MDRPAEDAANGPKNRRATEGSLDGFNRNGKHAGEQLAKPSHEIPQAIGAGRFRESQHTREADHDATRPPMSHRRILTPHHERVKGYLLVT